MTKTVVEDTENQLYSLLKILNENFELVQDLKDLYQVLFDDILPVGVRYSCRWSGLPKMGQFADLILV